ncbi:MAG TPA: methyltransferase domain-containing protein [Anaerolineae bacterium]|nr:methyltransferase domain-containing protein [Anaerolineae bacterium]
MPASSHHDPALKSAVIAFYSQWQGERTYVNPSTVVRALKQRRIPPDARILDIGFGNGEIAVTVAEAFPRGWVEGIDLTEKNVSLAWGRARVREVSNVSFSVADVEVLELPAARYDAVLAMQVMQFIAEPDALLRRVFRALRPGGAFLFATPFLPPDPALHPFFLDAYARVVPNSFQYRTEDAWYASLFDAGFERIYTAKAHWDPNAQPADWQRAYRQALAEHGLDYETARRHTWGGLISARKPRT